MSSYYVVSGHKSTAVSHCLTGNFTGPNDINLIVAKFSHFEVYFVTPDGLKLAKDIPVYGRISCLESYRPASSTKDLVFMLTHKYDFAILEFLTNPPGSPGGAGFEVITKANGSVADRVGRPSETGMKAIVDPLCRCIGLRLYDGLFKVIPLLDSDLSEVAAFNIRCEETSIIDITFLHTPDPGSNPTVCFIYQNHSGRHTKTCEVNLKDKEFAKGPWKQDNIEMESFMVVAIPPPFYGVLIIAAQSITYHQGDHYVPIAPPAIRESQPTCCRPVDSRRLLMGDMSGRMFMLILETEEGSKVSGLNVVYLGQTAIPECITYLDNGFVFVGSKMGDSQVIRLNDTVSDNCSSHLTVLESITNLGPIIDLAVVHSEAQGPDQLVTCSGYSKEGSLRIIRNGIGIHEMASIDLFGIKGVWSVRLDSATFHNTLVLSFVGQTRMLKLSGEDVEEFDIPGFSCDLQTLYAGNVAHGQIIQVTSQFVRLVDGKEGKLVNEWKPPPSSSISKVACNSCQLVVATGKKVFYLVVEDRLVYQVGKEHEMPYEVACIDITPVSDATYATGDDSCPRGRSDVAAFGLWTDISARIFKLPGTDADKSEFVEVQECLVKLGGEIIPRSVMMAKLDEVSYLLYAMGDGSLIYFKFDPKSYAITERRKVNLGTQPTTLTAFESNNGNTRNIFACSDRPTVIFSVSNKLLFSNVNLKQVTHMCRLNAEVYQSSLVLCNDSTLTIGRMDQIQKLHIRTVPIYESPNAIAYQEETHTFAVLTQREDFIKASSVNKDQTLPCVSLNALSYSGYTDDQCPQVAASFSSAAAASSAEGVQSESTSAAAAAPVSSVDCTDHSVSDVNSVIIFDQHTFEPLHAHRLGPNEKGMSVVSTKLDEDPATYYIVGTTYVYQAQAEPDKGRIIVFQWSDNKFHLISEKEIKGAPYCLQPFNKKLLVAVNHMVELYEWAQEKELRLDCSHYGNIVALYLKTKGDFVLVGDIMKSVALLLYKPTESQFEEIARDFSPYWTSAVEIIDDDTFLAAENNFNIFTCQKDSAATTDEERRRLSVVGRYHINDFINVFHHGSLVMNNPTESQGNFQPSILYGTTSGSIGLIIQLPNSMFSFLAQLEQKMVAKLRSVGNISHSSWRSFVYDFSSDPASGFVDGDLIEQFLDMPVSEREDIVKGLSMEDKSTTAEATTSAGSGKKSVAVDDVVKLVEELARLH